MRPFNRSLSNSTNSNSNSSNNISQNRISLEKPSGQPVSPSSSSSSYGYTSGSASPFTPIDKSSDEYEYNDPRKEYLSRGWRCPSDCTRGYSGISRHFDRSGNSPTEEDDVLSNPLRKPKIGGYSGYIPQSRDVCGAPIIKYMESKRQISAGNLNVKQNNYEISSDVNTPRISRKRMELEERYMKALVDLRKEHNQTQEILLRVLQSKLSERLNSYAQQSIRTRILFEGFDRDNDGYLNEDDFRECLENQNVQFDDVQMLSLFAYFDRSNTGLIDYDGFCTNVTVFNPKGGTAILPKMITQTTSANRM